MHPVLVLVLRVRLGPAAVDDCCCCSGVVELEVASGRGGCQSELLEAGAKPPATASMVDLARDDEQSKPRLRTASRPKEGSVVTWKEDDRR